MFNLNAYGVFFSPQFKKRSPLRILSEYEIELYSASNASGFVDGEEVAYLKDQVCIFRPGQQRQSQGQFSCYYLKKLPTQINVSNNQELYQLFHDIFNAMAQKLPGYKLFVYGKLCQLVALLYADNISVQTAQGKYAAYNGAVYEAIRYMQEHLDEHITLEDIAGNVHLSPSFFHVVFKEILQKTPHRYLLELRLSKAKHLLVNSELSLAMIAEICGFDSQVYLNYIIKKELGVTPKKYRDNNRNRHYTI